MCDEEPPCDKKCIIALLTSWHMPQEIIESFRSNGISTEQLCQLNDNHLKELCPILGTRITLKTKITEYLEAQAPTETVTNTTVDSALYDVEEVADVTLSIVDLLPQVMSSVPEFDLKTLLETSPGGKSILLYYATHKGLDSKRKNRLTDIIIRHLFTHIINHRLSYDDYNVITGKIISLFPKETPGTYFTRPVKKAESGRGKSIAARGKLIDKVRNILFQSREGKHDTESESEQNIKRRKVDDILLDLLKDDIEWLQNNGEPWSEVTLKWNNTTEIRHGKDYTNVEDFLSQWKILKNPRAASLIDADFDYLYPGKGTDFQRKWTDFFTKFVSLKQHEITTDDYKNTLLTSLSSFDTEGAKLPTQLTLLVNVVPPKGRVSKTGKFSTQECLESLMIIVEKPADINSAIKKQMEAAAKRKLQVQPYIVLQGSLEKVHQAYLIIDEVRYTFDSIPSAFDILFKCLHVFNAKYPKPSEHIHLIIQRCVYEITTKYDHPVPYISDILGLAK